MATRVWDGGSGFWTDPAHWATATEDPPSAPQPGDTAEVATGEVRIDGADGLDGAIYNGTDLKLGDAANDPACLNLSNAYLEKFFSIEAQGSATINASGRSALACKVSIAGDGTVLTIAGDGSDPNGLLLTNGGRVSLQSGATLDLEGSITDEARFNITTQAGSVLDNNAAVTVVGPVVDIKGALTGNGSVRLLDGGVLYAEGSVSAGQSINFGDVDGVLQIAQPDQFAGSITNFGIGNWIDFTTLQGSSVSYDPGSQVLTFYDTAGQVVAALQNVQAAPGQLVAFSDGSGGTYVALAGTRAGLRYAIAGADRAMRSDVVHDTMTVPGTSTPITGAGVRVGVISNSFDARTPGTADADAAKGYLPSNPDGTSAVTVLSDLSSSSGDEGRAMAELIHQVAPGAQLYFATAGTTEASFAKAVSALAQAGCNVIVDDIAFFASPFYQVTGGAIDAAEAAAVAQGVSVFTSAGNFGQAFLEQTFAPEQTTLADGTIAPAHRFDNGTPYERITVPANTTTRIDLQWTAPYQGVDGSGAPDALTLKVFNADGSFRATAGVLRSDGVPTTDLVYLLPNLATATDYKVAVSLNDGQVSPDSFKFILSGVGTGSSPGGIIDDPAAGQGSGDVRGHELIPGVNTVGESYFANSPAFGLSPTYNDGDSGIGPGTLLFDSAGNPLPAPVDAGKVTFDAPTGINTTVPPSFMPFFGTSAAAPNAAAVAALMLQANPGLTPAQVTAFMQLSALDQGLVPALQGAGLVQADGAVALAIAADQSSPAPITPDTVSFDTGVGFVGQGGLVPTGQAIATPGKPAVNTSDLIAGLPPPQGAANPDVKGAFTLRDLPGSPFLDRGTAALVDGAAALQPEYSLQAGVGRELYAAQQ